MITNVLRHVVSVDANVQLATLSCLATIFSVPSLIEAADALGLPTASGSQGRVAEASFGSGGTKVRILDVILWLLDPERAPGGPSSVSSSSTAPETTGNIDRAGSKTGPSASSDAASHSAGPSQPVQS